MAKRNKKPNIGNLKSPPVVEAWIEFHFDLSEENIPWTEEQAVKFIEENFKDYTPKHIGYFARIQTDSKGNPDFSQTDKFFDRLKAFSEDGQYCIQVGRNVLILNQINKGKWLGYDNMRKKAFEVLEKYSNYRFLDKLVDVCLHYRDVIHIPKKTQKIELEDYFKIFPKLEQSFGDLSGFKLDLILPESCKEGITFFTLLSLSNKDTENFNFQMDWHVKKKSTDLFITNFDEAGKWLDQVHLDIRERFKDTFTDKTEKIFRSNKK